MISMFEAKTNLSKYVAEVESNKTPFIVIARNGKPVAKLVPYDQHTEKRIGIAAGILREMPDLEEFNSIDTGSEFEKNGGLL